MPAAHACRAEPAALTMLPRRSSTFMSSRREAPMDIPEESYDLYYQFAAGKLSRFKFISRMAAIGCTALTIDAFLKAYRPGVVQAAERALEQRPASPADTVSITVYDWILNA